VLGVLPPGSSCDGAPLNARPVRAGESLATDVFFESSWLGGRGVPLRPGVFPGGRVRLGEVMIGCDVRAGVRQSRAAAG